MAAAAALPCPQAAGQALRTTDGRRIDGNLVALDAAQAVLEGKTGRQPVPLAQVADITLAAQAGADLMETKGRHVLWTRDGSFLAVRDPVVRDGKLDAVTDLAGSISVPLECVARILRPAAGETPAGLERELRELGPPKGREDLLVVRPPGGKCVGMAGLLSSLGGGQIAFTYEGAETTMKDDSVVAIVLAAVKPPDTAPASAGHVIGADGSRIAFTSIRADGEGIVVEGPSLGKLRLRRQAVAQVAFRQGDATFLSDLAPAEVAQTPFFDDELGWQKDKSVSGQRLSIDGTAHEKGLGLHAHCRLTFDLQGQYRRLTAVAGIDGDLRSGRAVLSILADGKGLIDRVVLDRTKPAHRLDLPLRGVGKLAVIVDFAEGGFGSGARVNLCDAALTR
jgi:hypothetical protein